MSLPQKYLKLVSELAARGTIGVALLLGAAASGEARQAAADQQPTQARDERVSERLAAIREAVSALADSEAQTQLPAGERRLSWHNWGGGWGGGGGGWGWGRPWGNFGFGGPWNNWNNWRYGWNNSRNGWGNF